MAKQRQKSGHYIKLYAGIAGLSPGIYLYLSFSRGVNGGGEKGEVKVHRTLNLKTVNTTLNINTLHPQSIESRMGVQLSDDIGEWSPGLPAGEPPAPGLYLYTTCKHD